MKLRLPHKFQAALMAAIASVSFTTLSTGTLGAAFFVSGQAFAEDTEEDPSATIDIGDTNLDAQAAMEEEEGTAETKEPGSAPINEAGFNGGPGNNAGLLITESVDIDETALDTVVSSEPVAVTSGSADSTPAENLGFTANPYATDSDTSNGSDDFSLTGTAPAAAYVPGQSGVSASEGDSAAGTGSGSSTNKTTTGAIGSIGGIGSGAIGGSMALTASNLGSPVSSLSVDGSSLGGDSGSLHELATLGAADEETATRPAYSGTILTWNGTTSGTDLAYGKYLETTYDSATGTFSEGTEKKGWPNPVQGLIGTNDNNNRNTLRFAGDYGQTVKTPVYTFSPLALAGFIVDTGAIGFSVNSKITNPADRSFYLGNNNTTAALSSINENFTFNMGAGNGKVYLRGTQTIDVAEGKVFTLGANNGMELTNNLNMTLAGGGTMMLRTNDDVTSDAASVVTLAEDSTLQVRADGATRTYSFNNLEVSGSGHLSIADSGTSGQGHHATVNIGNLSNADSSSAVLSLGNAARSDGSVININGGSFNGEIVVRGEATTGTRNTAVQLKHATVAQNAVVSFDVLSGKSGYNNVGLGIGTNVSVKGINTVNAAKSTTIYSGSKLAGFTDFNSGTDRYSITFTGEGSYSTTATVKNNLNLVMSGTGAQTFSGDMSAFDGSITVNSGTLALTRAVGNANVVSVTGGTLDLSAALTTTDNLSVDNGATLKLAGAGADLLSVNGNLTLAGNLDVSRIAYSAGTTVTLASYTGTANYAGATITGLAAGQTGTLGVDANNHLTLTFGSQPEPKEGTFHVYVLTGQSNSLGAVKGNPLSAELLAAYQSQNVKMWDANMGGSVTGGDNMETAWHNEGKTWFDLQPARTPGSDVTDTPWEGLTYTETSPTFRKNWGGDTVMGPEYGFGYMLEKKGWFLGEDDGLGVIKASRDGGGDSNWEKGQKGYSTLLNSIKLALDEAEELGYETVSLDGLMYLQGESNGSGGTGVQERYLALLSNLKQDLTKEGYDASKLTFDTNSVLGEIATWNQTDTSLGNDKNTTVQYQEALADSRADIGYVHTRDLDKITQGDTMGVHYNGEAQLTIGARYAYAFAVQKGIDVGTVRGDNDEVNLNEAGAWWMNQLPGQDAVVVWDLSSVSTPSSAAQLAGLGNNIAAGQTLTVGGVRIEDPYKQGVIINGGTLSIGTSGIELQGGDLSISSDIDARASQTWNTVYTPDGGTQQNHLLTTSGTVDIASGATLTIAGDSQWQFNVVQGTGSLVISDGVTLAMTETDLGNHAVGGSGYSDGNNGFLAGRFDLITLTGDGAISVNVNNISKAGALADKNITLSQDGKVLQILNGESTIYHVRDGVVVYNTATGITDAASIDINDMGSTGATLELATALANNVTITSSGNGGAVKIDNGVVLNQGSLGTLAAAVQLTGEGTLKLNSNAWSLPSNLQVKSGASGWTGTVELSGGGNFAASNLNGLANGSYSTIRMHGVSGWSNQWDGGHLDFNIDLEDNGNNPAWNFNAGSSDNQTFMVLNGDISGHGILKKSGNPNQSFKFAGDLSNWDGAFVKEGAGTTVLHFMGNAHTVKISTSRSGGNLGLSVETDATFTGNIAGVNNGLTVTPGHHATFNGTTNIEGDSSISGTVYNGGTMTLGGTVAVNAASLGSFEVYGTAVATDFDGQGEYVGSGFRVGEDTKYYLLKSNDGSLTNNVTAYTGATKVNEGTANDIIVTIASSSSPDGVYYVNSDLTFGDRMGDAEAASINISDGKTLTLSGPVASTLGSALKKATGSGNVLVSAETTVASGTTTLATGNLTVSDAQLNLGSAEGNSIDISSFSKLVLDNGVIKQQMAASTYNNVTVDANKTGEIASIDMNTGTHNLAGDTMVNGTLTLANWWNAQFKVENLLGDGTLAVKGTTGNTSVVPQTTSQEEMQLTIDSLSSGDKKFTGSIDIDHKPNATNKAKERYTIHSGNQAVSFAGLRVNVVSEATVTYTAEAASTIGTVNIVTDNSTLTMNGDARTTITSLTGAGNLKMEGSGTLVISATDNYTGDVTVNAGKLDLTSAVSTGNMTVATGATLAFAGKEMLTLSGTLTLQAGSTLDLARIFETQEAPVQANLFQAAPKASSLLSVGGNSGDSGLLSGGLLGAATPAPGDYILATANTINLNDGVLLDNIAQGYTGSLSKETTDGGYNLILTLAAASSDLIWDNHAETGKWNTTDDNWHVGTATAGSSKFQTNDDVKFTKATNGQIVTLDGDITAGNITIEQGADITIKDDNQRLTGTLKGSGTYALAAEDKTLPTGLTLDPTDWVGTVRLTDVTQNALDFSQYVNGNLSTLELKGFTGWSNPWRGDINQNIKLTNTDTDGSAWVNGAYSGDANHKAIFGGTWSGTGTFERTGSSTMDYEYTGNISDWTGMFKMNAGGGTTVLSFSDAADTVNAEIKQTAGTLNLELKQATTFNKNVTVSKIAGADYTMTLGSTDGSPANLTVTGTQNTLGGLNFTGGKHTVNLNGGATNATVATIGTISGEADINITSGNGNRTYNLTGDLSGWTGTLTQTTTSGSMNLNISGTNELNADIVNATGASNCTLALNLAHNMDVNGSINYTSLGPVNVNVGDSSNKVAVNFTNTVKAGSVNVVNNSTATFQNNVTATTLYQKGGTINIGDANHHVVVNTGRLEAGDSNTGTDSSVITVAAGSLLNVTGSSDGSGSNPYKDASLLLGEWGIPTTVNVAGSLVAANAQALVGDKGFTATIAADGVMAVKGIGICRVNDSKEQSVGITLQEGGKLILGSSGITADRNSNYQLSAGEIGISADNVAITPGMELNSAEGTTFNTAKYTIGTDGTITEGTVGGSLTISGALSGTGKLVKDGAGTLNLNTANTYAGGTEVNAGTLVVGANGALGSGTTTVNSGGTLELTSTVSTLNNTISIAQGGTLALGNYKDKAVTIGTLTLGDNSILDLSALSFTGTETEPITLVNGGTIDPSYLSSVQLTFAGAAPEGAQLAVDAGGNLVLTFATLGKDLIWDNKAQNNSWTTSENWHTEDAPGVHIAFTDGDNVQFTSTPAKPNPTLGADVSAGTMQIDSGVVVTVNTGANKLTVADLDSTGGSLTVGGTGSATFGGSDDEVTLSELQITGGNVVFNEHVHVTGNNSIQPRGNSNVTFKEGISFDGQGGGYGYAMIIKSGSSATLGGTTNVPGKYIGPEANTTLTLAQGAEVTARGVRNSTKLSSNGNVVLEDRAKLITRDGGVYTPNLTLGADSSVTLGGTSQLGGVTGSGDITVEAGTVTMSGANTGFTGDVTVNGGTIELGNNNALGTTNKTITINTDGAIDLKGHDDVCYTYTLSGGTLKNTGAGTSATHKQTAGLVLTDDSYVSGTGDFHVINDGYNASTVTLNGNTLTKTGSNTVHFVNTEITTGKLAVNSGTLNFRSDHDLSRVAADIELNGGTITGAYKYTNSGSDPVTRHLDAKQTVTASAAVELGNNVTLDANVDAEKTLTMSGAVTGSGSLVKSGEGTLELTAANSYTGTTTVDGGTLVAGAQGALGSGLVTVNDGGTLQLTSSVTSINSLDVERGGTLTFARYGNDAVSATALTLNSGSILDVSQLGLPMGTDTAITLVKGCGPTETSGVEVFFGDVAPEYTLSVQNNNLVLTYQPAEQALIWDNATGNKNWSTDPLDTNWHLADADPGTSHFTQDANVIFTAGDSTAALQQNITAGTMTVQHDANVTVDTNLHDFAADINLSGTGSVTFNTGEGTEPDIPDSTVTGTITGAGDIHKDGNGILMLDVTNTSTGAVVIDDGTVVVNNTAALGQQGYRDVEVNLGGNLVLDPAGSAYEINTLSLDRGSTLTFSGVNKLEIDTLNLHANSAVDLSNIYVDHYGEYVLATVSSIIPSESGIYDPGKDHAPDLIQFVSMDNFTWTTGQGDDPWTFKADDLISLHYRGDELILEVNSATPGFYWKPSETTDVSEWVADEEHLNWSTTSALGDSVQFINQQTVDGKKYSYSAYFLDAGTDRVEEIDVTNLTFLDTEGNVKPGAWLHDFILANGVYNFTNKGGTGAQLTMSNDVNRLSNFVVRSGAQANFDGVIVDGGDNTVMHVCKNASVSMKNISQWSTNAINNEGSIDVKLDGATWKYIDGQLLHLDNTGTFSLTATGMQYIEECYFMVGEVINREDATLILAAPEILQNFVYGGGVIYNEGELVLGVTTETAQIRNNLPVAGLGTMETVGAGITVKQVEEVQQTSATFGAGRTELSGGATIGSVTLKEGTKTEFAPHSRLVAYDEDDNPIYEVTNSEEYTVGPVRAEADSTMEVQKGATVVIDGFNADLISDSPIGKIVVGPYNSYDEEKKTMTTASLTVNGMTKADTVTVQDGGVLDAKGDLKSNKLEVFSGSHVYLGDDANSTGELAAAGRGTAVVALNGATTEGSAPVLEAKKLSSTDDTTLRVVNTETGPSGRRAQFNIGQATPEGGDYQGVLQYGVGANAASGSGMDLHIKDNNVAAGAVLEAYYDSQAPAGGSVNIIVDTGDAMVLGLSDNIDGPDASRAMKVSGTEGASNKNLYITGDDAYVYAGKLGSNLNIAYTGDGSQTFEGGVDNFNGSVTVDNNNPANDAILVLQNAASVNITDLTIGSNDKLQIENGGNVGLAQVSGTLTAKGGSTSGSSGTASVLNGDLALGGTSTFDVSAAGGQGGLNLTGALTINTGAQLSANDLLGVKDLGWFEMYDLAFGVTDMSSFGQVDWSVGVDVTEVFANTGLNKDEYYVRYSQTEAGGNGSNVGAVYIYHIPEPTTSTLSLLALAALAARRRRK